MKFDDIFDVLGAIVIVALATALTKRGGATARIIDSLGRFFSGSIKAAVG